MMNSQAKSSNSPAGLASERARTVMKDVQKIENLEQLRLLSDPLKLSLLQAFGETEATVATAAEALGEPLTKLYRHVDALLDAGLIEVTRECPKRGTVERWFRTVARRFEVADDLLTTEDPAAEEQAMRDVLRGAETELLAALREKDETVPPTFARFRARVTPAQLEELRERLFVWLDELESDTPEGDDAIDVGAVVGLYRLPKG
jgi:DNA-binding transcriptional ArsR family regulator